MPLPYIPSAQELSAGRNGDTHLAHVAQGEVVVPNEVLQAYPQLGQVIAEAYASLGGDPNAAVVGSPMGSYNPETGHQEFFFKSLAKIFKPVLKTAAPVVASALPGGRILAPIAAGAAEYLDSRDLTRTAFAAGGTAVGQALGARMDRRDVVGPEGPEPVQTVNDRIGGINDGWMKSALGTVTPNFIGNSSFNVTAGAGLGALGGSLVGGMMSPSRPEQPAMGFDPNYGAMAPAQPIAAPVQAPPAFAAGTSEQVNYAPDNVPDPTPYAPPVNYLGTIRDRFTGAEEDEVLDPNGYQVQRNARRGGWASSITFV